MQTAQIDIAKLNLALQFAQELLKPVSSQNLVRMVHEAIIPPAPSKDAPKDEKAVEASAEAHKAEMEKQIKDYIPEGETNG